MRCFFFLIHSVGERVWSIGVCIFIIQMTACIPQNASEETVASAQAGTALTSQNVPANDCRELATFQTISLSGHLVDIATPPDSVPVKADMLILQGWDFPKDDWCKKSTLCKKTLAQGYRLIMPETGLSVYASRLYPETREDWLKYPTRTWVTDTLIPYLQKTYCLLEAGKPNFITGLSTGARGAALIALYQPKLFRGIAALSGDYDQRRMPQDRLMQGYYGSIEKFPERWEGEDNLITQIGRFQTPVYFGHGLQDKIVPPEQTRLFYDSLKKRYTDLALELHMPDWAEHDYTYWDYEVDRFLKFFENFLEDD